MHFRDLAPLHFLRTFEAAGRLGSFKAAAAELHVTPSAVSQQLRVIEDVIDFVYRKAEARDPLYGQLAR